MNIEMFRLKNSKICLEFIYGSKTNLPYAKATFLRKETFKKYIVKAKTIQPGQTWHSVSSDLVLHCLHISYLQTIRQLITWTQSRPNCDRIVLSYKRKINTVCIELTAIVYCL